MLSEVLIVTQELLKVRAECKQRVFRTAGWHGTEHRWAELAGTCTNLEGEGAHVKSGQEGR